jgi:hypothetical protein
VKSARSGILAITLSVFLAVPPVWAGSKDFVGVGTASGSALINGVAFSSGSNLYSTDRVQTQEQTNFLLLVAPDERAAFSPNSSAQLRKDGNAVVVGLQQGKTVVQSSGRTRISLDQLGVEVRTAGLSPALAEVTVLSERQAQVSALRGSLEIIGASKPMLLHAGQAAMLTDASLADPPQTSIGGGSRTGEIAIVLMVFGGATTATYLIFNATHTTESPSKP